MRKAPQDRRRVGIDRRDPYHRGHASHHRRSPRRPGLPERLLPQRLPRAGGPRGLLHRQDRSLGAEPSRSLGRTRVAGARHRLSPHRRLRWRRPRGVGGRGGRSGLDRSPCDAQRRSAAARASAAGRLAAAGRHPHDRRARPWRACGAVLGAGGEPPRHRRDRSCRRGRVRAHPPHRVAHDAIMRGPARRRDRARHGNWRGSCARGACDREAPRLHRDRDEPKRGEACEGEGARRRPCGARSRRGLVSRGARPDRQARRRLLHRFDRRRRLRLGGQEPRPRRALRDVRHHRRRGRAVRARTGLLEPALDPRLDHGRHARVPRGGGASRLGAIRPVVDSTFRPEDASSAYERLESGSQFGKIVFDWRRD